MKRRTLGLWLPVALWAAAIFILSSFPALPEPPGLSGLDKPEHYIAYAGMSILVFRAVHGIWNRWSLATVALVTVIASAFYGATDEVHQIFVPPRCCEFLDWVADMLGAISGVIIASITVMLLRRRNSNNEV